MNGLAGAAFKWCDSVPSLMSDSESAGTLDPGLLEEIRNVLDSHPVTFAMIFGSMVRTPDSADDLDIAVEFDEVRPEDDGYSPVYLRLRADLNDALSLEVDVVDVHSMDPRFAGNIFEHAQVVLGSERRRRELEDELARERPTFADARDRIAKAAARLREGGSS